MVKDSALLVCDRSLRNLLDEYDGPVLYTDEIDDLPADLTSIRTPSRTSSLS